jgi:hypothetical protein
MPLNFSEKLNRENAVRCKSEGIRKGRFKKRNSLKRINIEIKSGLGKSKEKQYEVNSHTSFIHSKRKSSQLKSR